MQKDLFLELELPDIENKLRELLFSKHCIKVWSDADHFISLKIRDIQDEALKVEADDFLVLGQEYFCSFSLRQMHYYFKITVEVIEDNTFLKPLGTIYRSERRRDIRFLMHPRMNAYLYLKINSEIEIENSNVISINRFKSPENKVFEDFQSQLSSIPEIGGESVLDISEGGLSFACTVSELDLINFSSPSTGTLVAFDESISLEDIEIIYEVDYLNTRIESVVLKKVGIKFKQSEELNELLVKFDDNSIVLTSLDENFQKFIDSSRE